MIRNTLSSRQKKFLRAMGMELDPVVMVGKEGLTPTVVIAAREAIKKRELIKVSVQQNCLEEPENVITMLTERADADLVQISGRNRLLCSKNCDKPRIGRPKSAVYRER